MIPSVLTTVDWLVIGGYFVISLAIGLFYARRAGKNTSEFFLAGRNLPWWLAGTSMVATTFAADTPLAVTELVAKNGIAGNWLWWNFMFGGMLTVFFFARLWRRAGIQTDVEFVELRYSGKAAAFLRGFRALYLGVFINCVIMGWVNLAMATILEGMFGIPKNEVLVYVGCALILTALYSALSGLWGVAVTDAFQFVLAMAGTIILAIIVLNLPQVGGIAGLQEKLPSWVFQFSPTIGESSTSVGGAFALSFAAFLAFVGVQWWSSWYPGAEPGGGGYVAQRMMSAKDEKHSLLATLWFTVAHYCIRPWPWILVGLASLILYPELAPEAKRLGYVYAMRDFLPAGIKGMLIASFFAAYMSTVATQLNWGTSYVINDFYKRFISPSKDFVSEGTAEKNYVFMSRIVTLFMMILSLVVTSLLDTIAGAWTFLIEAGAGIGLVLILRWFWWRVNAWSEISAMAIPLILYGLISMGNKAGFVHIDFPVTLYLIVSMTTLGWLVVTFLTKPTHVETLERFYARVHPGGAGWRKIAERMPNVQGDTGYGRLMLDWLAGVVLVFCVLFGTGKLLFGDVVNAIILLGTAAAAAGLLIYDLTRRGFSSVVK